MELFGAFADPLKGSVGTTLGLPIVKRIIDLHSVHITLEDGRNGKGLKVCIELPKIHVF